MKNKRNEKESEYLQSQTILAQNVKGPTVTSNARMSMCTMKVSHNHLTESVRFFLITIQ